MTLPLSLHTLSDLQAYTKSVAQNPLSFAPELHDILWTGPVSPKAGALLYALAQRGYKKLCPPHIRGQLAFMEGIKAACDPSRPPAPSVHLLSTLMTHAPLMEAQETTFSLVQTLQVPKYAHLLHGLGLLTPIYQAYDQNLALYKAAFSDMNANLYLSSALAHLTGNNIFTAFSTSFADKQPIFSQHSRCLSHFLQHATSHQNMACLAALHAVQSVFPQDIIAALEKHLAAQA